ncbi:MAG: ABC transporter permease [Cytophagales bacterium]|nr:ABC transporter permease [Cytophagales bacterium]
MNLAFFIARRYFFSTRKKTFITVISLISVVALALGTMSLIVVLSVFNGLEKTITGLYNSFDPDLKVSPARGKSFALDSGQWNQLTALPGVYQVVEVIEDNALIKYRDAQMVAKVKGISDNFIQAGRMAPYIVEGQLRLSQGQVPYALVGRGLQYALSVLPNNDFYTLQIYYPKDIKPGVLNPESLYTQKNILPGGIFAIEKQLDESYIFVPLVFAQELMGYGPRRSYLEIKLSPNAEARTVQKAVQGLLGQEFAVATQNEQHHSLIRAIKIEKLFVHIIFVFILAVVSFNTFFSLGMLAIDKKKDIGMLYAMGSTSGLIRRIFLYEGAIIAFSGSLLGLALGYAICWTQLRFGWVRMGMQGAIIDAYPVDMQWSDFYFTAGAVALLTLLSSYRPAYLATRSATPGIKSMPN